MNSKLVDSELKVMEVIWREGELPAKSISQILNAEIGWNKNTTYTIIKRCIEKNAIERREPNFICSPLVNKEQVQEFEVDSLVNKLFGGSVGSLFASLVGGKKFPDAEIEKLKSIIGEMDGINVQDERREKNGGDEG